MKILIIGGYGVFGGRLADLLSDIAEIELLICGRNFARSVAFCEAYKGVARVTPLLLDRKNIVQALSDQRPDLVVDASGPFQHYGEDVYNVVEACIAAKIDYLDFADAADFVFGIAQFDSAAKEANIFVLSGVSSFPVLTAAVLQEISKTMDINSVTGGIAPSPYAGIGLNVMRAVVGYAGSPIKLRREGKDAVAMGLTESMRYTIAVPGRLPLKNTHFSLVDVPDLQVIPSEYKTLKDIWMGAGPVPEVLHRILNLLAKARAKFHLPSLIPLSGLFYKVLNLMKFGEHRGGMFVHAKGYANGKEIEQSWHLLAEGDDGPYIPSMAIEALIRKTLSGQRPAYGARAAINALTLADYEKLFEGRSLYSGMREMLPQPAPLYRHILGEAFEELPNKVRELHDTTETRIWAGKAEVRRGSGWMARIVAEIIGFPKAAAEVPVTVVLRHENEAELWTRSFAGKQFSSLQKRGSEKNDHLLVERFGAIEVALALLVDDNKLVLVPRRWSIFGIPLPKYFLPTGQNFETEKDGYFCFNVEVKARLVGLIVAYKGQLKRQ